MTTAATSPELDRDRLRAGADQLGLALTDAQIGSLCAFGHLLLRWNRVYNLTAIRRGEDVLTHHLLDSLAILPPLRRLLDQAPAARLLDVGAGGGLPGIPVAIALPELPVTLVDAVQKKAAFLTQAALELRLRRVEVRHARVEVMDGRFELISSRAFASVADFLRWTRHLLAPGGAWLAMKARLDGAELAAIPDDVELAAALPLVVPGLDEARHLLILRPRVAAATPAP